ncbi:MAG: HNH endonuclease [Bacteroidales bacterium]|jgi:putative restriction endonuclease|nr:HNH endonuclease [Bacteroidales bacterium]
MKRRAWTREELILAFNLYLRLPFGKMHKGNQDIIYLSKLIDRTSSSVSMRLVNFASVDPYHQARGISGLKGGFNQVKPIWDEFNNNREELLFESEQILAKFENHSLEEKYERVLSEFKDIKGAEKERLVKTRVNQHYFREVVLANYSNQCAITGIDLPELLNASHIIPWSKNEKERLNPTNGICLSKLYDAAFDRGLIGIKPNYEFIFSRKIKEKTNTEYFKLHFGFLAGQKIKLPQRFKPNKQFLEYHLDEVFLG